MALVANSGRLGRELELRNPADERRQGELRLEPCEWSTEAEVDARAERDVVVRFSTDVESIGFAEDPRVAVCGTDRDQELGPCSDFDPAELDVVPSRPPEELHRRLESQEFLDGE